MKVPYVLINLANESVLLPNGEITGKFGTHGGEYKKINHQYFYRN